TGSASASVEQRDPYRECSDRYHRCGANRARLCRAGQSQIRAMRRDVMKHVTWSIGVLLLALSMPARPDVVAAANGGCPVGTSLRVSEGSIAVLCPLTVGGNFEAKSNALNGELVLDPRDNGTVSGEIAVDLRTLQTGIGLRDSHMRDKYLEVHKGGSFES